MNFNVLLIIALLLVSCFLVLIFAPLIGFAIKSNDYRKSCPSPCSVFIENPIFSKSDTKKKLIRGVCGCVVGLIVMIWDLVLMGCSSDLSIGQRWLISVLLICYLIYFSISCFVDGKKYCDYEFIDRCKALKNKCFYSRLDVVTCEKCKIFEEIKSKR